MRTVWVIEKLSCPPSKPSWLAEGDDEVLVWTADLGEALRFVDRHLALRFAQNRTTVPVSIVDRVEDPPAGWAASNIDLRDRRDAMDAFKAAEAAAAA